MSDNNGCAAGVALIVIMAVFVAAMAIGGPVITSAGLAWDNSSAITRERERTERTRIQANRDIQIEEQRGETARQVAGVLALVGGVAVVGWTVQRSVTAWAARPHRPVAPPATIVMLAAPELAAAPEAWLEWSEDDGAWVVVNPRTETVKRLEERSPPRQIEPRRA